MAYSRLSGLPIWGRTYGVESYGLVRWPHHAPRFSHHDLGGCIPFWFSALYRSSDASLRHLSHERQRDTPSDTSSPLLLFATPAEAAICILSRADDPEASIKLQVDSIFQDLYLTFSSRDTSEAAARAARLTDIFGAMAASGPSAQLPLTHASTLVQLLDRAFSRGEQGARGQGARGQAARGSGEAMAEALLDGAIGADEGDDAEKHFHVREWLMPQSTATLLSPSPVSPLRPRPPPPLPSLPFPLSSPLTVPPVSQSLLALHALLLADPTVAMPKRDPLKFLRALLPYLKADLSTPRTPALSDAAARAR